MRSLPGSLTGVFVVAWDGFLAALICSGRSFFPRGSHPRLACRLGSCAPVGRVQDRPERKRRPAMDGRHWRPSPLWNPFCSRPGLSSPLGGRGRSPLKNFILEKDFPLPYPKGTDYISPALREGAGGGPLPSRQGRDGGPAGPDRKGSLWGGRGGETKFRRAVAQRNFPVPRGHAPVDKAWFACYARCQ